MEAWIPVIVAILGATVGPYIGYRLGGRTRGQIDQLTFYRTKITDLETEVGRLNTRLDALVDEQAQDKRRWIDELNRTHRTLSTALARQVERAELAEAEVRRLTRDNQRLTAMVGSLAEGVPDNA